jgi:5-methylcytosine-specific restriction endonuclease McrA
MSFKYKSSKHLEQRRRRRSKKKQLIEFCGGECVICGYNKCISSLHFHHLEPLDKEFKIADQIGKSMEELKKEASKCILLCANCHGEVEFHLSQWTNLKKQETKVAYKHCGDAQVL